MLGYTRRELVGHNISKFIPEPFSSVHQMYMKRYLRTGKEVRAPRLSSPCVDCL